MRSTFIIHPFSNSLTHNPRTSDNLFCYCLYHSLSSSIISSYNKYHSKYIDRWMMIRTGTATIPSQININDL